MKNILCAALLGILLFSCGKQNAVVHYADNYTAVMQASLRDFLNETDYASLDFAHGIVSSVDSLHLRMMRVLCYGKSVATDFFVVKTDVAGRIYSGQFVIISKDTSQQNAFTGTVAIRSMKGVQRGVSPVKGHVVKTPGNASSLMADEPEMDGGELPPVVVTASYGSGGISYADWYNLLEMAGGDGNPALCLPCINPTLSYTVQYQSFAAVLPAGAFGRNK